MRLNTPLATIGVRGTTLDFLIEDAKANETYALAFLRKAGNALSSYARLVFEMIYGQILDDNSSDFDSSKQ